MHDRKPAAILRLSIPGVGQLYNGSSLPNLAWLVTAPGCWIGTGGLLGEVCRIISAYIAYTCARDHRART
jgi:hypothetical protein